MVQRPRPDLRGGCAAMRIPTATGGEGLGNDPSYPAEVPTPRPPSLPNLTPSEQAAYAGGLL